MGCDFGEFILTVLAAGISWLWEEWLWFCEGGEGLGEGQVYFYFGMVWGDAETDEAVGDWERFVHVDVRGGELREHTVGSVEAGWSGTDDGHAERGMVAGGGEEAGVDEGAERKFLEEGEGGHWGVLGWWGCATGKLYVGHGSRFLLIWSKRMQYRIMYSTILW